MILILPQKNLACSTILILSQKDFAWSMILILPLFEGHMNGLDNLQRYYSVSM